MSRVISDFEEQGLQSDDRFTEVFIHNRIERGYGPIRIKQELRDRSISDDLINQFINMHEPMWGQKACRAREKRFGQSLPLDYKEKAKQSRFLQYRGFTIYQIRKIFSKDEV